MKLPLLAKQMALRSSAIVIVKIIGLIGRISLTRLVGAEGVGLYQIVYSFYGLMLMLITGGLPTALALYTANHVSRGWALFKLLSLYMIVIGGFVSLLIYWFSSALAQILGNPQLVFALRCLAPALFAVPLLALLRGFLQGVEKYELIAFSEIMEQVVRVGSLLLFVPLFLPYGVSTAVGGGILGTFTGALLAFAGLIISFFLFQNFQISKYNFKEVTSDISMLYQTSLVIAFTRLLIPASDFIDAILIPNRLQAAGYSSSEATAMFGVITGMAIIVVYSPTLITAALSHTLTVKIAADWQEGRKVQFCRRTYAALELGWLWGWASGLFLFTYSAQLSWLIFGTEEASNPIKYLAFLPLIVGLREMTTSVLWAQDRKRVPLIGLIAGICLSLLLFYFLVAIPNFGYIGAAVSILAMELVAATWNLQALKQVLRDYFRLLPLLCDVLILVIMMILAAALPNVPGMILFFVGAGLYMNIRILQRKAY
ncbi:oligosaccharide flippase family protein [Paenibacillus sp. sgz302251]|uniref:oligosaccharide flippase family protein n=1 Tax=Paenibacillus sp. sgz302251 TaxID=3414493 RepID=UPI003C7BF3DD